MITNLFVNANVKQLRTGGSFRTLLPFFRTSWGVGVLNSTVSNIFHNRVEFCTILEGLRNFGGGVLNPQPPLSTPLFKREGFRPRLEYKPETKQTESKYYEKTEQMMEDRIVTVYISEPSG